MDPLDFFSDDGQAMLALCSAFATKEGGPAALTLSEWNELEERLRSSEIAGPSVMQGWAAVKIAKDLSISEAEAERIAALLERSGQLSRELKSVFSRGIWATTRLDEAYPKRLRTTLKQQAPTIIFGAGEISLLDQPGVAIVGSRNIDETGTAFAHQAGKRIVDCGLPVVSGGARGTDRIGMYAALEADGKAIGALADSLEATIRKPDVNEFLGDGRLVMLTPYAPDAGFSVGAAMGRNKVIYGLSEFAIVVSSEVNTGGTWAGAVEALKGGWCPLFVRNGEAIPAGNHALIKRGAKPLSEEQLRSTDHLVEWMRQETPSEGPTHQQGKLFE